MPRNVQKDPEASSTWLLKDEIVRRGKVYYAKLARGKTMFLAPRMIPYFHAIWGDAPIGGGTAPQQERARRSCACSARNGRWRRQTCATNPA